MKFVYDFSDLPLDLDRLLRSEMEVISLRDLARLYNLKVGEGVSITIREKTWGLWRVFPVIRRIE